MRTLVLGGYSCMSDGADVRRMSDLADELLAPLLQYLYKNAHFEFTLYITCEEMEWLDSNRPALQKLISRLIRRKSLSLLITSRNHCFMPLASSQEVADQVEQMRSFTRKFYKSKCKGFFSFGGFWSPELIAKLVKSDISYSVVPTFTKDRFASGPFFMSERGRKFIIYPSDHYLSDRVNEHCMGNLDSERLKADIERYASRSEKDRNISFFMDFDPLLDGQKNPFSIIDTIFTAFRDNAFKSFNTDNDISFKPIGYLSGGSYRYGEDFIADLFKNDETFDRIAMISYASLLSRDKLMPKKDRETISALLAPISYGNQFVPGGDSVRMRLKAFSGFFSALGLTNLNIPEIYDLDSMGLKVVKKKGYIAFLDIAQGCVRKVIGMKSAREVCFSAASFRDVVQDSRKGRGFVKYGSFSVKECNGGGVMLEYQNDSTGYAMTKSFAFTENAINCSVSFESRSPKSISFVFAEFFSLLEGNAGPGEIASGSPPSSSERPSGFLEPDALLKTVASATGSDIDPKRVLIPYYDITLVPGEAVAINWSVSIPKTGGRGKKRAETEEWSAPA